MSGPSPKHGALETDIENEALVASGPSPKHGSAALSVGAAGATEDGAVEPESGLQEVNV
jgi:hypothetical protein